MTRERWGLLALTVLAIAVFFANSVSAYRFSSSSYVIDASVGNNFGGQSGSSSYSLVGSGGETIVGNGAGGSYKIGMGYVAQLPKSLQLTVQPDGLVGYWSLDEGAGNAAYDTSAQANSAGVAASSASGWVAGKVGGGYNATATTGNLRVPDNASLPTGQSMTVSLWASGPQTINATLASQWDYSGGTPTSGAWALQTSSSDGTRLRFIVASSLTDSGVNYVETPAGSWTSGWHQVTVTFDGTQGAAANRVKVYIDGVSQALTMTGSVPATLQNANAFLCLGDFYGLSRPFGGSIDEVKIYNRVLSINEVGAEYAAGSAGLASGVAFATDILAGSSQAVLFDAIVSTDASNYSVAIQQNQNLTSGPNTIPAISSTVASPTTWSEGTTKGLGFSLASTNATAIDGKWSAGNAYAALPGTATTVYSRTGVGVKDVLGLKLKLDVTSTQAAGVYTNIVTVTGTMLP